MHYIEYIIILYYKLEVLVNVRLEYMVTVFMKGQLGKKVFFEFDFVDVLY